MYLINTTFVVPRQADADFTAWLSASYRPALVGAGYTAIVAARVLVETEPGTRNYAVQFRAGSAAGCTRPLEAALSSASAAIKTGVLHFTTAMAIIDC